jgi:hypothetical protein
MPQLDAWWKLKFPQASDVEEVGAAIAPAISLEQFLLYRPAFLKLLKLLRHEVHARISEKSLIEVLRALTNRPPPFFRLA